MIIYPSPLTAIDLVADPVIERLASSAPFTTEIVSTILTLMYDNAGFVSDEVLPRIPTESEKFDYAAGRGERYIQTPTQIGRTGAANRISSGYDMLTAIVNDFAIEYPVPKRDIATAPDSHIAYSPIEEAVDLTTQKLALDREIRVANLVRSTSSYMTAGGSGFDLTGQVSLAAADRWSTYATSDPLKMINGIRAKMLVPANLMLMNWEKWITLSQHPKLVQAANGSDAGSNGMISQRWFEELLNLKIVLAGCWVDNVSTSVLQTINMANMSRVWGNDVLLLHVKQLKSPRQGGSWGFTAQWRNRVSFQYPDAAVGVEGAMIQKTGEYVREIIADTKLGFLIQNAFA